MIELNKIYNEDCLLTMKKMDSESVDMVLTSPPYDNLRNYNGFTFDFESIAKELFRVLKLNGVIIWVVGDATINGSETGTSFKQALYFKDIGFNLHDTMIWNKGCFSAVGALQNRYAPVFEYMFILSKGFPKSFNPIKDRKNLANGKISGTIRQKDGTLKRMNSEGDKRKLYGQRFNIWNISPHRQTGGHPAPFPEQLAFDQIKSWTNENDVVYDPFMGSGTTAKIAIMLKRNYLGSEISKEYFNLINKRINNFNSQPYLF